MPQLINADNGEVLLVQLEIADTFWKRFKGLQFRRSMPQGSGLLLRPCSSLHTCFMRFPIDVVMLDRDLKVVAIRRRIPAWRAAFCRNGTWCVVETTANAVNLKPGMRLKIESAD